MLPQKVNLLLLMNMAKWYNYFIKMTDIVIFIKL